MPQFYPPTIVLLPSILTEPAQRGLALLQHEVFGPVITAMRFETDEVQPLAQVPTCLSPSLSLTLTLIRALTLTLSLSLTLTLTLSRCTPTASS